MFVFANIPSSAESAVDGGVFSPSLAQSGTAVTALSIPAPWTFVRINGVVQIEGAIKFDIAGAGNTVFTFTPPPSPITALSVNGVVSMNGTFVALGTFVATDGLVHVQMSGVGANNIVHFTMAYPVA